MAVEIVRACESHVPGITEIYNYAVLNTTATFDTETKSVEDRREWLLEHDPSHPILAAVEDGEVLGWASLTEYSPRAAYRFTCEDSVYVHPGHFGRGIGSALLARLIDEAKALGIHTIIGRVVDGNEASIKLHERYGFATVGKLEEVGMKFDRWLDVLFVQKIL